MKVLTIDTETGGIDPRKHSCLSVGFAVMDLDSGEILDTYESLIRYSSLEDYVVTEKALKINGLSVDSCFHKGVLLEDIQDKFMEMWSLNKCEMLAGHNTVFDIEFLAYQIFDVDKSKFFAMLGTYRYLDSMSLVRLLEGHNDIKSGASLEKSVASLNIKMTDFKKGYHTALYDAVCAGRILAKFRRLLLNTSLKDTK